MLVTRRLPFQWLPDRGVEESATPFPGLLHFTLDHYLIVLRAKQGRIKYHFLSLWYDSTWASTTVSRTIGEHSTHLANGIKPNQTTLINISKGYSFHFLSQNLKFGNYLYKNKKLVKHFVKFSFMGSLSRVVDNVLDCDIVARKFER